LTPRGLSGPSERNGFGHQPLYHNQTEEFM
jgi:hypothetical protein